MTNNEAKFHPYMNEMGIKVTSLRWTDGSGTPVVNVVDKKGREARVPEAWLKREKPPTPDPGKDVVVITKDNRVWAKSGGTALWYNTQDINGVDWERVRDRGIKKLFRI